MHNFSTFVFVNGFFSVSSDINIKCLEANTSTNQGELTNFRSLRSFRHWRVFTGATPIDIRGKQNEGEGMGTWNENNMTTSHNPSLQFITLLSHIIISIKYDGPAVDLINVAHIVQYNVYKWRGKGIFIFFIPRILLLLPLSSRKRWFFFVFFVNGNLHTILTVPL